MTGSLIEQIPGGFQVDGLKLLRGNCGCGAVTGPGGSGAGDCCFTYSTVIREGNVVAFFAKGSTPHTRNNYEWGYRVRKGNVEVDVLIYDTKDPKDFTPGGHPPPPVSAWEERGWEVLSCFERCLRSLKGK